jgi:protein TonB
MSAGFHGASPNARFLVGDVPTGEPQKRRFGNAFSVSLLSHIGGFLLFVVVMSHWPEARPSPPPLFDGPRDIVWIAQEGPGGGGGGGGNQQPEPVRKAELPGKEKITVPVEKPQQSKPKPEEPKPEPKINIPAQTTMAALETVPGAVTSLALPTVSQGVGTQGGAGSGQGTGFGPGTGSGLGPGEGGGTGGGFFRPGNGVTSPFLIKEVKPGYTSEAMRAKIQGVVLLEAVVNPDGTVGNVQITRSLDPTFGLDQEAIKTVKKWVFAPGKRLGQPVPVLVEIEMTFTLR